jgi:hypothetical protein
MRSAVLRMAAPTVTASAARRFRVAANRSQRKHSRDRTEIQHERIDLAARGLAEVSARLQAAANAVRESI